MSSPSYRSQSREHAFTQRFEEARAYLETSSKQQQEEPVEFRRVRRSCCSLVFHSRQFLEENPSRRGPYSGPRGEALDLGSGRSTELTSKRRTHQYSTRRIQLSGVSSDRSSMLGIQADRARGGAIITVLNLLYTTFIPIDRIPLEPAQTLDLLDRTLLFGLSIAHIPALARRVRAHHLESPR